jgi:aldehyde:ferredoxin oxidoreductase
MVHAGREVAGYLTTHTTKRSSSCSYCAVICQQPVVVKSIPPISNGPPAYELLARKISGAGAGASSRLAVTLNLAAFSTGIQ